MCVGGPSYGRWGGPDARHRAVAPACGADAFDSSGTVTKQSQTRRLAAGPHGASMAVGGMIDALDVVDGESADASYESRTPK